MGLRGESRGSAIADYTPEQVKAVIENVGIEVDAETYSDFICFCPFHSNNHSPSFTVGVENGLYICFNPTCSASSGGNLVSLVMRLSDLNVMEAKRYIEKRGGEVAKPISTYLDKMFSTDSEFTHIPQMVVDDLAEQFWKHKPAVEYMMDGRGFTEETLRLFEVGWDPEKRMVVVPIHDARGNPIGVNGRSIVDKHFKLSRRVPRNKVLFNLHRAKTYGGKAAFCESQFDVMKLHQAGFPYGLCSFGSHISKEQFDLIQRHFGHLVIFTDADEEGRKAGRRLSQALRGLRCEWAIWELGTVYPHGAKDAGDLTEEEIAQCMANAISDFEYWSYIGLQD